MEKEIKEEAVDSTAKDATNGLQSGPAETVEPAAGPPEHNNNNGLAQKRGRIIVAGALTAVLLSVVAVAVAGIFGATSHWMKTCPTDLPLNDPARELSQQLVAEKTASRSLGVSGRIAEEARFKSAGSALENETTDTGKGN
jgi:hypothetical protein